MIDAQLIRPIYYREWVSNIVPIWNPTKSIYICTYFRDLNLACPTQDFPLPKIDIIVDKTIGHEMLSLMDLF